MRVYRMALGYWGFGFNKFHGGWSVWLAKWVFTTEP